jgi:hypothetical protein
LSAVVFSPNELALGALIDQLRKVVTGNQLNEAAAEILCERYWGCVSPDTLILLDRLRGRNEHGAITPSPWFNADPKPDGP